MLFTIAGLLVLMLLGIGARAASTEPASQPSAEVQAYIDTLTRIEALRAKSDLKGLAALAEEIQAKWAGGDANLYGRLMAEVVGEFASHPDKDERQRLKRKYALLALQRAHQMPVEVEARLIPQVMADFYSGLGPSGEAWSTQRTADLALWFHAWKRVNEAIDPNWDPVKDSPHAVFPPAGVKRAVIGMSPEGIEDPVLREQYRTALAENGKKSRRYTQQVDARRLDKEFSPVAENYIVRAYSEPPANLEELRAYLDKFVSEQTARERILKKVQENVDELKKRPVPPDNDVPVIEQMRRRRMREAATQPATSPANGSSTQPENPQQ